MERSGKTVAVDFVEGSERLAKDEVRMISEFMKVGTGISQ